jgi:S-methylmethionine-dependent homocysteine/selenocysteine methylase
MHLSCFFKNTSKRPLFYSLISLDAWFEAGAVGIGGCCRTSPEDILNLKKMLCRKIKE